MNNVVVKQGPAPACGPNSLELAIELSQLMFLYRRYFTLRSETENWQCYGTHFIENGDSHDTEPLATLKEVLTVNKLHNNKRTK